MGSASVTPLERDLLIIAAIVCGAAAYLSWALRNGEVQFLLLPFSVSRQSSPISYWASIGVIICLILFCCWSAVDLWRGDLQP